MDFIIRSFGKQDDCNSIVRCICFNNKGHTRHPTGEDRGGNKAGFEVLKGNFARVRKIPGNIFMGEASEGNDNVRVIMDEKMIEISKTKERLNVFNFPGLRPVKDSLYLAWGHGETGRGNDISKVFDRCEMEITFSEVCIQAICSETSQDLSYMFVMLFKGI